MSVSVKFYLTQRGRQQVRRARIPSVDDFNLKALQGLVLEVFPHLSLPSVELGYTDDEGDLVSLVSDGDVVECCDHLQLSETKVLRIEVRCSDDEAKTGRSSAESVTRASAGAGSWLGLGARWCAGLVFGEPLLERGTGVSI
jgi:hypothetical protein